MYLIFSDTHFTKKVDKKRLEYLKKLISNVDRVIINGDLWDSLFITFDDFINSGWSELFPLLKKKRAVYIYGNHDKKDFTDDRVYMFSSTQCVNYKLNVSGVDYYFSHGDDLNPSFTRITKKVFPYVPKFVFQVHYIFERFLTKTFGYKYTSLIHKRFNVELKETSKERLKKNAIYVCGHTHHVEDDSTNRFVNTGYFDFGVANYLLIDNKGKYTLKRNRY